MANIVLKSAAGRFGALAGGAIVAATVWLGLGGSMGAAPRVPDAQTCLPTCVVDGRSFVVAGNDPTTLSAQAITIGLTYTSGEPVVNFEIFDADHLTNWDTPLQCGAGCPDNNSPGPVLVLSLYRDPAGDGTGGGVPANLVASWTPGGVPGPIEQGAFAATNNTWSGDTVPHDPGAEGADTNFHYALVIGPFDPASNKGWNAFKIRANGTVSLLGNQIVGFIGAMNVGTSDFNTIYPAGFPNQTGTPYNGQWIFPTTLPPFLGDVTVFDGDMDFGNAACAYNDTDDPDSSGIPPFAAGSAAAAEGVAVATGNLPCNPGPGIRTGSPAEDGSAGGPFTRVPSIVPNGIAYQLRAPDGQVFLNQNPSGNKEWEQFKIQKVNNAADINLGACPANGYPESPGFTLPDNPNDNLYPASDCRTLSLPGGNWQVELDGMDLANLNFWFFSFKVEPPLTEYSIGRRVWFDTDGDGVEDPGEPGANGVTYTVTVFDSPTGIPDGTVVRTGTTVADGGDDGLIEETGLPAGNYTVTVDASNFDPGGVLEGFTSTTGGEVVSGREVGLPVCTDTNVPAGCGQPIHADAIFGYDIPSEGNGVITPTSQECQHYAADAAVEVNPLLYKVTGGNLIENVTPGGFIFMTEVTVGAGQTLSVSQSHTGSAPVFLLNSNEAKVYDLSCVKVNVSVSQNTTTGEVTFGALPAGTYILRLKISGPSVIGQPAPSPATSQYTWIAELNGVAVPGTQNTPPLDFSRK